MGTGLGGHIDQALAVLEHDGLARRCSLVQRKLEHLLVAIHVVQGEPIGAVLTLAEAIGPVADLYGGKLLAVGGQADLGRVVDEVKISANKVLDRRAGGNLVNKLSLDIGKVGVELATVGIPGEVLQEYLTIKVGGVLVVDVHVVASVDHRLERVVRAPERDVNVARRVHIDGDGVRGAVIAGVVGVLVVVLSPVLVRVLVLVAIVLKILAELLGALHGLRENEVRAVGELLPVVLEIVLARLPLPDTAHFVRSIGVCSVGLWIRLLGWIAKRPRIRFGVIAVLAVKVGCTVTNKDHVLVLGLNGSIRVEDALCGKKASVHVSARMQAGVHCVQDVIIPRDDVGQRLLDVTDPVEEDYADLDVQTISLGFLANLLQEFFGLFVNVRLRGSARLIEHKHNVGRLGLALARERKRNLRLQILVKLGRRLLVLL